MGRLVEAVWVHQVEGQREEREGKEQEEQTPPHPQRQGRERRRVEEVLAHRVVVAWEPLGEVVWVRLA